MVKEIMLLMLIEIFISKCLISQVDNADTLTIVKRFKTIESYVDFINSSIDQNIYVSDSLTKTVYEFFNRKAPLHFHNIYDVGIKESEQFHFIWNQLSSSEKWKLIDVVAQFNYKDVFDFAKQGLKEDSSINYSLIYFSLYPDDRIIDDLILLMKNRPKWDYIESIVDIFIKNDFRRQDEIRRFINDLLLPNSIATHVGFGPVYLGYKPQNYPDERKSLYPCIEKLGVEYFKANLYNYYLEEKDCFPLHASNTVTLLELTDTLDQLNVFKSHLEEKIKLGIIELNDITKKNYNSILEEYTISLSIARLLYRYGDKTGRALLIEACGNKYGTAGRFASENFELYGMKEDLPHLVSLLDADDWRIRRSGCCGLYRLTGINIQNRYDNSCWESDANAWKEWYSNSKFE